MLPSTGRVFLAALAKNLQIHGCFLRCRIYYPTGGNDEYSFYCRYSFIYCRFGSSFGHKKAGCSNGYSGKLWLRQCNNYSNPGIQLFHSRKFKKCSCLSLTGRRFPAFEKAGSQFRRYSVLSTFPYFKICNRFTSRKSS